MKISNTDHNTQIWEILLIKRKGNEKKKREYTLSIKYHTHGVSQERFWEKMEGFFFFFTQTGVGSQVWESVKGLGDYHNVWTSQEAPFFFILTKKNLIDIGSLSFNRRYLESVSKSSHSQDENHCSMLSNNFSLLIMDLDTHAPMMLKFKGLWGIRNEKLINNAKDIAEWYINTTEGVPSKMRVRGGRRAGT